MNESAKTCTAFRGTRRIASGNVRDVALKVKEVLDRDEHALIHIFDDETSELIHVDFRGTAAQLARRLQKEFPCEDTADESSSSTEEARRPGRPKLGVVAREVTLLPRHWEWLASQPGGASVALRKLVEHAAHASRDKDRVRRAKESAYRFMSATAGNEPGYEEAIRALFAGQQKKFEAMTEAWPADIRAHARKVAAAAFTLQER